MHCKTTLLLVLCILIGYTIFIVSNKNQSNHDSTLTTKEFIGKVGQKMVINAFSNYNSEKRERTILEKNIRNLVMETGQTGKNVELISEVGESSVHYVIDKSQPIIPIIHGSIDKIKEYTKPINYKEICSVLFANRILTTDKQTDES